MRILKIYGGNRLQGEVEVNGAKNSILPLMIASLLASSGKIRLYRVPSITDVKYLSIIFRQLGVAVDMRGNEVELSAEQITSTDISSRLAASMRVSVLLLGSLLARAKEGENRVSIPRPGGCKIGSRQFDLHLEGLRRMGAVFEVDQNRITGFVKNRLEGADISLRFPSVGATLNLLLAAVLAKGETNIFNAAKDPEIEDVINFLNKMGAKIKLIKGNRANSIRIQGVGELHAVEHTTIPDRIEAGTYMIAAAATGGDVFVEGAIPGHLTAFLEKLREMGVQVDVYENGIHVQADHPLKPVHIKTGSYPKFPTDLQPPMMVLQVLANGISSIQERIFPNRFTQVPPLLDMGAEVYVDGNKAWVKGGKPLIGATVKANDMRAAAALIIAALAAEGVTVIYPKYLNRGYEKFPLNLKQLGADVKVIDDIYQKPDHQKNCARENAKPITTILLSSIDRVDQKAERF